MRNTYLRLENVYPREKMHAIFFVIMFKNTSLIALCRIFIGKIFSFFKTHTKDIIFSVNDNKQ